ncbi:MAG: tetratricopeptide repeat-containing sensor histidine kinase [Agriterribacter sp.]
MMLRIFNWQYPLYMMIGLLLFSCSNDKKAKNSNDFSDFRFRKIQSFVNDSAHYFKAMDSVYADLPPFRRVFETYNCKRGYFFTYKRDYIKSLSYSDSILNLLSRNKQEAGYPFWYPQALLLKADDLHALKRYTESFTYYYMAREAIYKSGDTCLFADYSNRLGLVSYKHNQYKAAAEYFKQAFQQKLYCRPEKNSNSEHMLFAVIQSTLDNIGICYSRLGMQDSSLYYFDSALQYINHNYQHAFRYSNQNQKIADTNFIESAKGVIYGNMATDLMALGNDSAAERLLKSSIAINSKPMRALEDVAYSQGKLAQLYIKQQRLNEASEILGDLREGLDTLENGEMERKWNSLQSEYFAAQKDFITSNEYLKRYMAQKDSIAASEYDKLAPDLDETFGYLKTQQDLYAFQRDDERKNQYLIVFAVGLILIAIITLLIWNSYRLSKKHINMLGALNSQLVNKQDHLQKALSALQTSHEENNRIINVVAHDLRNPVSGIAGMSDFLLKEDNYDDTQKRMLQMIQQSSYHSLELIQGLSEINNQPNNSKKEPIDLPTLLSYCTEMLRMKAEQKSQKIELHAVPLTIIADREKIWRVFSNLIGNAIKFSKTSQSIAIEVTKGNDEAIVAIKDNGIGIPEILKDKIFFVDESVKRKGTAGEQSFGLGLSISKQIVEEHNGKLWFESEEGNGTTFYVSLPLSMSPTDLAA